MYKKETVPVDFPIIYKYGARANPIEFWLESPWYPWMVRKKNVQHLDSRYSLMVENAYYQANPPDKPAIQISEP